MFLHFLLKSGGRGAFLCTCVLSPFPQARRLGVPSWPRAVPPPGTCEGCWAGWSQMWLARLRSGGCSCTVVGGAALP